MIFDKENLLSDDQAMTTTAVSESVIDLSGVDGVDEGPGEPLDLLVQVTADLATGTSVDVSLETDDDEAFGSAVVLGSTGAIATAALVAGYRFAIQLPKEGLERYIRLVYTIVGTFDAGTITAGLVLNRQKQ